MNYRHHYHAGNFADAFKHAFLVALVRHLQAKPKGLLLLDTHAGRGEYDLAAAGQGDSRPREPEHPRGIGRILSGLAALGADVPPALAEYAALIRAFSPSLDRYPGSPRLLQLLARPEDRIFLCELQPEEFETLRVVMGRRPQLSVQAMDGYAALKSALPPPERRALVLIDPPFEDLAEWQRLRDALAEALRRFPSGTYALWHPVTARADADRFWDDLAARPGPPTWAARLVVDPRADGLRGCGLIVLNPPWAFGNEAHRLLAALGKLLSPNGLGETPQRWLRPEA
ncbi:MAG TPA: 23S rRNA (adenine(2030)-N(6))-methyltransferase RlmJ [Opitutaceae bacterium]